ncbi:MAG: DUF2520 domain-containing protein [Tidjanibacter sp.]|nr:DUF2520 domain-containing protein [Tidjanibacter sp.]
MRVIIIGSGNVATHFALASAHTEGVELAGVWARNAESGSALAERCGVEYLSDPTLPKADLYIISVSDRAVAPLSASLIFPVGAVVAHTAGSIAVDELSANIIHRAVVYPLQTFSKGRMLDFSKVPLFIEGATEKAEQVAMEYARLMSRNVRAADSIIRRRLHLAGVFVCNFVNRMYGIGAEVVGEDVGFDLLKPLIEETALKALSTDNPANVQTGPAVRGDKEVWERHKALLSAEGKESAATIYEQISNDIWQTSKKS